MILDFVSYDSDTTLATAANYKVTSAAGDKSIEIQSPNELRFVTTAQRAELVDSDPKAKYIELSIGIIDFKTIATRNTAKQLINKLFNTDEPLRKHTLIMQDTQNSNKKWLMYCAPKMVTIKEGIFVVLLGCFNTYWLGITRVQLNGALTATAITIAFDNEDTNSGTFPAYGWGWIDDGRKEEFITWGGKSASPAGNLTTATRGVKFWDGRRGYAFAHDDGKWIYSLQLETTTNPAHNSTFTVTPEGNKPTEPIIRIKPTGARTGATAVGDLGQLYTGFVELTNPNAFALDMGEFGWPSNLADAEASNGFDTAAFVNDTTVSNQINNVADIGAGDTTIDIDTPVGGGLPTSGMGYVGTEQIAWTGNSGTQLTGCIRGIGGTTAAAHLNNAVIARSKMLANGDDIQVWINGQMVNRWLQDMNTASTEFWVRKNLPKALTATLGTAIAASGAISAIVFASTSANAQTIQNLPNSGIVKIGSEYFTYTGKVIMQLKLTGITRAAYGSAEAAHASGVTITRLPHEIIIKCGRYTTTSPNTADADDFKPMFDLTSENARWDYTSMDTELGGRAGEFGTTMDTADPPQAFNPEGIRFYTANRDTFADPAEETGIRIKAYKDGTIFSRTRFKGWWEIALPGALISDVTLTGEHYATDNAFYPTISLRYGNNRTQMLVQWTQAAPTADATWENLTKNGVKETLGANSSIVQLFMEGEMPQSTTTQYQALVESTSWILDFNTSKDPVTAIGNFNETAGGGEGSTTTVNPDIQLTNQNIGKIIAFAGALASSEITVADTERQKFYRYDDNANMMLNWNTPDEHRRFWFELLPEANTILFEDQGTGNVTIDFFYFDRNA